MDGQKKKRIIVVGGGAAGMMAAFSAAGSFLDEDEFSGKGFHAKNEVLLFEKNEKLGKKLYITGKGRCNLTNHSDVENLLSHVARNAKFLYSAFYMLDAEHVMGIFENAGLELKTERGNRVFPVSDKSSDVIKTMKKLLEARGVQIFLNRGVERLFVEDGICKGVCLENGEQVISDAVIVATGGCSYASTGSTGDGYRFARELAIEVKECFPSLVPFVVNEEYIRRMQGVSLKNVVLKLFLGKKKLYEEQGELLFTHFGVSGPLVLTASTEISGRKWEEIRGEIDLKPALSAEKLDDRLLRDFAESKNHYFKNSLGKLLPAKMIPEVIQLSEIHPEKRVNEITKEERKRLLQLLKAFPFTVKALRGFEEAIITRGGVSVKEIDPSTMEAKKVTNLYFAGEVLDLDAETGGYNLQIAWSTGYLAGRAAGSGEEKDSITNNRRN